MLKISTETYVGQHVKHVTVVRLIQKRNVWTMSVKSTTHLSSSSQVLTIGYNCAQETAKWQTFAEEIQLSETKYSASGTSAPSHLTFPWQIAPGNHCSKNQAACCSDEKEFPLFGTTVQMSRKQSCVTNGTCYLSQLFSMWHKLYAFVCLKIYFSSCFNFLLHLVCW